MKSAASAFPTGLDENALNQSDQYKTHIVKVMQLTLQEMAEA